MSFVSSVVIKMLERELAGQTPEIEAYALQFIGQIAGDLVAYVEKKVSAAPAQPVNGAS